MNLAKFRSLLHEHPTIKRLITPATIIRQHFLKKNERIKQSIYDNLCDILVDNPVIKLPEFDGQFVIDCRSDLFKRILFHKSYEDQLTKTALRYIDPNRDTVDIGANIGFFTVLFAKRLNGKRVLAIEPTASALAMLHNNITINNITTSVCVFEGVASNSRSTTTIKSIEGRNEYSTIGALVHPSISGESYKIEEVSSSPLDDLITKYQIDPGFIKIDVEGSEHLVFDGARTTLATHRPIILSELSNPLLLANGSSSKEVISMISRYDYTVMDPLMPTLAPGKREFGDILCIPKEFNTRNS